MTHQYYALGKIGVAPIGEIFDGCNTETQQKISILQMDAHLCQEEFDENWKNLQKTFQLRHELLETVIDSDKISNFIILPERGKSLKQLLRESKSRLLQRVVRAVIHDVLELLEYFHRVNFIHGDIRPDALLLPVSGNPSSAPEPQIRLAYSPGVFYGNEIIFARRERKYLAPEMINPQKFGAVSPATDMFCLAFTALELLFGEEDFNNMFCRIGADGNPNFVVLLGDGDERLPALKSVFPGIDADLYYFFHSVIQRKVSARPASPRDILARMKNKYLVQKLFKRLVKLPIDRGIFFAFRDFFSKLDWEKLMTEEIGSYNTTDEIKERFIVNKAVSHLKSFSVPETILNQVETMQIGFQKPDTYELTFFRPNNQEVESIAKEIRESQLRDSNNNEFADTDEEMVSDLTGKATIENKPNDPSLWNSFSEIKIPFSLTSKAWWDAQFKKKPVLYGLFGGIALILLLLLILSPSPASDRIPDGCSIVSESGIDSETKLPRKIEVTELKDREPLRLVLIKPPASSAGKSPSSQPRLGERVSKNAKLEPFYIAEKEVSVVQYENLIHGTTTQKDLNKVKSDISHNEAIKFCALFGGQLPTEDQWETAADYQPEERLTNMPGTMLQWCSEPYKSDFGETRLDVSSKDYLVKGISPLMFAKPEWRSVWRAPADEQGAPDIGFRPVVMPGKKQ